MYILLRHSDGRFREAIVLSLGFNSMRVSMPGEGDAVQLTLCGGHWISDKNEPVEIEFIAASAEDEWNSFFDRRAVLGQIDDWAAKGLPPGCVAAPAAAGRLFN